MNVLSEILDRKRQVVARLRADGRSRDFRQRASVIRANAAPHRLLNALNSNSRALNIIAEFKRRSPSAGLIRKDLSAAEIARCYERGGACAVSVLTDEEHFDGSILDLCAVRAATDLPILRKDFITDEVQIYEAAIAGADAVLLIVAALDDRSLGNLRRIAEDELSLDAVVEVHDSEELRRAVSVGAKIIGVNNRDLRTLRTSLNASERLIAEAPRDRILISESGLQSAESLRHLHALGFRNFLIGEALMRAKDPETALRNLVAGPENEATAPDNSNQRPIAGPAWLSRARSAMATPRQDRIQIKICGITTAEDARACIEAGVDMIGFNFYPRSPRYIEPEAARQIVRQMPSEICAVGVFVDGDAREIHNTAELANVRCVQLHGDFARETCSELARQFRVIRAFSTDTRFDPTNAAAFSDCDVLVDAYHRDLRGGTGQTCDWSAARATLPFTRFLIVSGGLSAENVGSAIAAVMPHAVDVCSGVESVAGVKNHRAVKQFIAAVREAERARMSSPS